MFSMKCPNDEQYVWDQGVGGGAPTIGPDPEEGTSTTKNSNLVLVTGFSRVDYNYQEAEK